jgi:hypothetical protein
MGLTQNISEILDRGLTQNILEYLGYIGEIYNIGIKLHVRGAFLEITTSN